MTNPSGFTAKELAPGQIQLSWKPVSGAAYYAVFGPGSSYGGVRVDTTTYTVTGAPAGAQDWLVASYYNPGPMSTPASAFTKLTFQSTGPAQTSIYRVVATGFRVVKETIDDPFDRDGVRNEVYAAFSMFHFQDGVDYVMLDRDLRHTVVYGDNAKHPNRVRAGTATPTGGLRDGDAFPTVPTLRVGAVNDSGFPFKVWEGSLTDAADFTLICPQLFEWSGTPENYDAWFPDLLYNAPTMWTNGKQWSNWSNSNNTVIPTAISVSSGGPPVTPAKFTAIGEAMRDRPIGIRHTPQAQGLYVPCQPLLLTRRGIEGSLKKVAPGSAQRVMLTFSFNDGSNIAQSGGNYILYLDVERVP